MEALEDGGSRALTVQWIVGYGVYEKVSAEKAVISGIGSDEDGRE